MALTLKNLLEGIYSAVIEARHFVNAQHIETLESYFERKVIDDPDRGGKIEVYTPILIAFATSRLAGDHEEYDIVETPALTVVPLSTLSIDTLEIEFEAKLSNFVEPEVEAKAEAADADDDEPGILSRTFPGLDRFVHDVEVMVKSENLESAASPAKVKVTFKIQEPPEGAVMLQEKMLDYLRK